MRTGVVVHRPELALVPIEHVPPTVYESREWWASALALTSLLSFVLFVVGMPLISVALIAASSASTVAMLINPQAAQKRPLVPEAIASVHTRQTYRAILGAALEIKRAVSESPGPTSARILERCETAVDVCARVAYQSNPLQRYLDGHDRDSLQLELERLQWRLASTADEPTKDALTRALQARTRQLATYEEIVATRDRIQARLEVVQASLESFAASLVKMRIGEEDLDGIGEDLDALTSALS